MHSNPEFKPPNTKETKILNHLSRGFTHIQMSSLIFLAESTITSYIRDMKKRYQVKSACELVSLGWRYDWINWDDDDTE